MNNFPKLLNFPNPSDSMAHTKRIPPIICAIFCESLIMNTMWKHVCILSNWRAGLKEFDVLSTKHVLDQLNDLSLINFDEKINYEHNSNNFPFPLIFTLFAVFLVTSMQYSLEAITATRTPTLFWFVQLLEC